MEDKYTKLDYFDNDLVYLDEKAQAIYVEIITKGKKFFLEPINLGIYQDEISELFDEIRNHQHSKTNSYSIFSRLEVKALFFEKLIEYKQSNAINSSISKENEYKKILLDALKLMYSISLYKKSGYNLKEAFTSVREKYHFLAFLHPIYLQEVYEGLINEVDYCIAKLSQSGLSIDIDFENGFLSTNGLKYSFLKETSVEIDFKYKNPFPRIFKNKSCYDLFLWLKENFVKNEYVDYSFIYYEMLERSFIFKISHQEYIDFLYHNQNIELKYDKLKSSAKMSVNKNNIFKDGIDVIKPNSMTF